MLSGISFEISSFWNRPSLKTLGIYDTIWLSRMRLGPFSKGRISKRVPPDFAVSPYFEVCVSEPLGVAHLFVEPQNMGTPPGHTIDTALRKGS
jgi:hypothetical protein